jgi:hypothetical protein
VSRIIKNVLPENVQITKDARAAFTRAAGIFIFYLVRHMHSTLVLAPVAIAHIELEYIHFLRRLRSLPHIETNIFIYFY